MRSEETEAGVLDGYVTYSIFYMFLAFKIAHIIDWSWWWVFSPYLIIIGLKVMFMVVASVIKYAISKADIGKNTGEH